MVRRWTNRAGSGRQAGFSLIELMLALALGMLVVTGIVQLFLGNTVAYNLLTGQARLQENGRLALDFLSTAVRNAGYFGCAPERENILYGLNGSGNSIFLANAEWPVQAFHNGGGVPSQAGLPNTAISDAGADVLTIRTMGQPQLRLQQVLQPDESPVVPAVGGDSPFDTGDIVVVADCDQAVIFNVTGVSVAGDDATLDWDTFGLGSYDNRAANFADGLSLIGRSYGADALLGPVQTNSFFIAESTSVTNNRGDRPLSLWLREGTADPVELIAGVEDIRVLFGIDTTPNDGEVNASRYVTFPEVPNISDIVTIRISVTVNSVDEVTDDPGNPILRRTFTETVFLRNARPEEV